MKKQRKGYRFFSSLFYFLLISAFLIIAAFLLMKFDGVTMPEPSYFASFSVVALVQIILWYLLEMFPMRGAWPFVIRLLLHCVLTLGVGVMLVAAFAKVREPMVVYNYILNYLICYAVEALIYLIICIRIKGRRQ